MALKSFLVVVSIFCILHGCYWFFVSFVMRKYVKTKQAEGDERSFLLILNDAYEIKPVYLLRFNFNGRVYLFFRRLFALILVLMGLLILVFIFTAQKNEFGYVILNNI